jgi:3-dehydroquinate synthase
MHRITLTPPAKEQHGTTIIVESGLLRKVQEHLGDLKRYDHVVVLYDQGIKTVAEKVTKALAGCLTIPVESGDASKSLMEAERIARFLLEAECTRRTLLVCIGGGMITDLGGFLASLFMRGIPCAYVPTSLLGMVDAAIGGKTAVNAAQRKNILGTVTHPESVLIDVDLLRDLPLKYLEDGLVEAIKVGAVTDAKLFRWMEEHMEEVLKRDTVQLEECVARAVQAKVNVVEMDDRDIKQRHLLNFGHTVGHAVEALSNFEISHGRAVAIGMCAEMQAKKVPEADRVRSLLKTLDVPLEIPSSLRPDALFEAMLVDKKSIHGTVRVAVPKKIGEGVLETLTKEEFDSLFS